MAVRAAAADDDDYYRILGVDRDVGTDALKRAYKRQALRWHPDKNQHRSAQAAERFKLVSEAYQALSDKQRRAAYNRRRPSAGNNEVLLSKTYGWPGVNISFYWTEKQPTEQTGIQKTSPEAQKPPTVSSTDPEVNSSTESNTLPEGATTSPLDLFKDIFEMDSPLAAIDKQLDGFRNRQNSFMESVFGSFKSVDSTQEESAAETSPEQAEPRPREQRSTCTAKMKERSKRKAFIEEEYQKGDLNEEEYKELIGLFSAPMSSP